jgi:hypothetical protein
VWSATLLDNRNPAETVEISQMFEWLASADRGSHDFQQ